MKNVAAVTKNARTPGGLGLGQVIKSGKIIYNIFLEPPFSILHQGAGQPKVQLFAGINLQFPKGQ